MNLSVVFSFKNEADVIPEMVKRIRNVLDEEIKKSTLSGYELIFVNDASTDDSLEVLKRLHRERKDIKIINMSRCFGVSPCVLAGLKYCSGDLVVYMDTDLQDPPELIPEMLKAWKETGADVVHTKRRSRAGESRIKLLITGLGYYILDRVSSIPLPREVGDFKLITRRVANHLCQFNEKSPYMRGLVSWTGFKQVYVEYDRQGRQGGKTKIPIFTLRVIGNFFNSALISFSSVPLHIASFTGLLSGLVGTVMLVYVVLQKMLGHNLPGWTALMVTILFIGSMQLFCLGIMGLYIHSILEEVKRRPNYIVESTVGFGDGDASR